MLRCHIVQGSFRKHCFRIGSFTAEFLPGSQVTALIPRITKAEPERGRAFDFLFRKYRPRAFFWGFLLISVRRAFAGGRTE